MNDNDALINEILDLEFEMFANVNPGNPASCQQNPTEFRLHRGSQFSVWSEDTLISYRDDLVKAAEAGDNLMTLKYARMQGIIEPINQSPIIDDIAAMELEFQKETQAKYPNFIGRGRPLTNDSSATSFLTYLKGELETYSEKTLQLLHRDLAQCKDSGRNWTEEVHESVVRKMGYESIEQVEKAISEKRKY
jgi:hypothetical protein